MLKRLLLPILILLLFLPATAAEQRDTLFNASKAESLYIMADCTSISITVKRFDNTNESYYYESSKSNATLPDEVNSSKFRDVKDVRIVEIDSRQLEVNFTGASDIPNSLTFEIPDPANRTLKSFVGTNRNNFGLPLSKSGKSQWDLISTGLGIGWVTPVNSSPFLDTSMGRSLEFTWGIALGVRWSYGRHAIASGLGFDWRNYSLKKDCYFHKEEDGGITLLPFEQGVSERSSRLQTFSLQIPVLYHLSFGKRSQFSFYAGPVLNFNTGGHISTKYTIGSDKISIKTGKIHQSPVTVDLMGGIGWRSFSIYARYAPMKVLRSSAGLDFRSFSTGIFLFF